MTKAGLDPNKSTYFTGWIYAWYMVAILKEAASYKRRAEPGQHHAGRSRHPA